MDGLTIVPGTLNIARGRESLRSVSFALTGEQLTVGELMRRLAVAYRAKAES